MESPIWFCGAPADPVAGGLARRVAGLGVAVVESPAGAGRAAVVLSPELAAADPPELGAWVADRGVDELVLVVAAGQAGWDEDAETFAGDAVPDSLRNAFRARPFVIDLRGADDAKLDRFAHRIAGVQEAAAPPDAANRRRRQRRVAGAAAVVIGVLLVAMVVFALGGSDLPMTATSTPTTGRTSTPSSSVPGTSDGSSNAGSWIVIAVLATALAVALVQLARRPKVAAQPAAGPAAAAVLTGAAPTGTAQVFISHHTAVDGPVAKELADRLRSRQLKAWIAPESVPPGTEWVFAIEEGLVTSQAALILISPSALEKGWVRKEIQMIVDLEVDGRLYVVPVVVTPCQVPLVLGAYQWVEVADFDRAADELARRFGAAASSTAGG